MAVLAASIEIASDLAENRDQIRAERDRYREALVRIHKVLQAQGIEDGRTRAGRERKGLWVIASEALKDA